MALLVTFCSKFTWNAIIQQRSNWQMKPNGHLTAALYLFLGWCLHYLPFYLMSRILYYHHYYPALIFNSLLSAIMLNQICEQIERLVPKMTFVMKHCLNGLILSGIFYSFLLFSPLSYGMSESDQMQHLKWIDSWEF